MRVHSEPCQFGRGCGRLKRVNTLTLLNARRRPNSRPACAPYQQRPPSRGARRVQASGRLTFGTLRHNMLGFTESAGMGVVKTFSAKSHEISRDWFVIDAADKV